MHGHTYERQYRVVMFDSNMFSNTEMPRHNGMNSAKKFIVIY